MTSGTEPPLLPEVSSFRERAGSFALLLGAGILVYMFSILTAATVLNALGQPISRASFVVGSLGAAAFLWWGAAKYFPLARLKVFLCVALGTAALFVGLVCLSGVFYDVSYDGQLYHQEGIVQLARGWNPLEREITSSDYPVPDSRVRDLLNHYARGPEIAAASVYKVAPHIERCKVFNFELIVASFCVTLCVLLRLEQVRPTVAVLLSVIAAANPDSVYQSFSFYVDGQLSSVLVCLFGLGVMLFRDRSRVILLAWASAIVLAVNVKFTGIPYAGIATGGFLIGLLIFKKWRTLLAAGAVMALAFVLGVGVLGYSPYVTNTIEHADPFYPLDDPEVIKTIYPYNTPQNFEGLNRLQTLFISVFSKTEDAYADGATKTSHWKWPFDVSGKEYKAVNCSGTVRVAGWGPLFGGAMILAAVILLMALPWTPGKTGLALAVMGIVFLSAIATWGVWWARYAPQLLILPAVAVVLAQYTGRRIARLAGWVLMAVLAINAGFVSAAYLSSEVEINRLVRNQLCDLSKGSRPIAVYFGLFRSNRIRLEEMGIRYREVKEKKDLPAGAPVQPLFYSTALFSPDNSP